MKLYLFGLIPLKLMCIGGGSVPQTVAPAPPPPPPPPPQLARLPDAEGIRNRVNQQNAAAAGAGGGRLSTILTNGLGDTQRQGQRKTLLGE